MIITTVVSGTMYLHYLFLQWLSQWYDSHKWYKWQLFKVQWLCGKNTEIMLNDYRWTIIVKRSSQQSSLAQCTFTTSSSNDFFNCTIVMNGPNSSHLKPFKAHWLHRKNIVIVLNNYRWRIIATVIPSKTYL